MVLDAAGICSPVLIGTIRSAAPGPDVLPLSSPNKTRCSSFIVLHLIPPSPPAVAATNLFPAALCPRFIHSATPALQPRRDAAAHCFCIASPRIASTQTSAFRVSLSNRDLPVFRSVSDAALTSLAPTIHPAFSPARRAISPLNQLSSFLFWIQHACSRLF